MPPLSGPTATRAAPIFATSTSRFLPFRPTLRFLYMYFWGRGFLDGRAGFTYCRLLSIYEYMIVLKMREARRRESGLST